MNSSRAHHLTPAFFANLDPSLEKVFVVRHGTHITFSKNHA
jgi:hypothetical protein